MPSCLLTVSPPRTAGAGLVPARYETVRMSRPVTGNDVAKRLQRLSRKVRYMATGHKARPGSLLWKSIQKPSPLSPPLISDCSFPHVSHPKTDRTNHTENHADWPRKSSRQTIDIVWSAESYAFGGQELCFRQPRAMLSAAESYHMDSHL